jgi:hypothetical protein
MKNKILNKYWSWFGLILGLAYVGIWVCDGVLRLGWFNDPLGVVHLFSLPGLIAGIPILFACSWDKPLGLSCGLVYGLVGFLLYYIIGLVFARIIKKAVNDKQ